MVQSERYGKEWPYLSEECGHNCGNVCPRKSVQCPGKYHGYGRDCGFCQGGSKPRDPLRNHPDAGTVQCSVSLKERAIKSSMQGDVRVMIFIEIEDV